MPVLVIPAIDILDGKCVRLYKGEYENQTIYNESPLKQAQKFEQLGVKRLHIVDLNGAKEGSPVNIKIISEICLKTKMLIEVGGGIRTTETADSYLQSGVSKIILGSLLAKKPEIIPDFIRLFGKEKLIAGIDFKNNLFATDGWLETTGKDPLDIALELQKQGFGEFIFTDISKDGTLEGPNTLFYQNALSKLKTGVIASGGIGNDGHLEDLSRLPGLTGVVVGKAYYENKITLKKWIS